MESKSLKKFLFQPKAANELINTATIVIDTNVLLAAYQYRKVTFKELIHTLNNLNTEGRLKIPSHVLKEFFKNRPIKIVEIIQTIQQLRDSLENVKKFDSIDSKLPNLEYLKINSTIQDIEKDLIEKSKEHNVISKKYRQELTNLIDELKSFFNDDPILNQYKTIFEKSFYKPESYKSEDKLLEEFKERVKKGIPPGYKDSSKDKNEDGDYIIWDHILHIDSDVIFITADNKSDWVYKDPNGNIISARRELVEEFFEASNGKTFCVLHPSTFIKEYNPEVTNDVIDDMEAKLEKENYMEKISSLNFFLEKLKMQNNNILSLRVRSKEDNDKLIEIENSLLKEALYLIRKNPELYEEALKRVSAIYHSDSLSKEDKDVGYQEVAFWIFTTQDD